MSHQTTNGPGGVPLGEILDLADSLGRQIAALGITDPDDRKTFCVLLGEALTDEFLSTGLAEQLLPYQERLAKIAGSAIDACFTTETLPLCAALGARSGPAIEMPDVKAGTRALMVSFVMMRKLLGLPASDFLDLFVWVQTALLLSTFLDARPGLAAGLGVRRPNKRSRRRRVIRH